MRVVVVDDHELVRAGVTALISRQPDIEVVGEAASGEEALAMVARLRPDIAVVDHSLGAMTGVEVCRRLAETQPEVAVIILTATLDDTVVRAALAAGARAYVYKDVEAAGLVRALRAVARGEAVLDPKVAGRVARWAGRRRDAVDGSLTTRELEVLRLVASGATNRAIADTLHLSENTVRTYLRRIMTKLDCHTRSEAVAAAAGQGLL